MTTVGNSSKRNHPHSSSVHCYHYYWTEILLQVEQQLKIDVHFADNQLVVTTMMTRIDGTLSLLFARSVSAASVDSCCVSNSEFSETKLSLLP
jgi:hypothetical protein